MKKYFSLVIFCSLILSISYGGTVPSSAELSNVNVSMANIIVQQTSSVVGSSTTDPTGAITNSILGNTNVKSSTSAPSTNTSPTSQQKMDLGYIKRMDMLDVVMMMNGTMNTVKYLDMYDQQRDMPEHEGKATMEMMIDVSANPMLEVVDSMNVETMNRTALMGRRFPAAHCGTYKQIISIPNDRSTTVILDPSCIAIEQCAGCCPDDMTCRPTATKDVLVEVMKYVYDGDDIFAQKMVDVVKVQEHTSCMCECKVQEHHCTPSQTYDSFNCKCQCNNRDQAANCPHHMVFDETVCGCQCASNLRCSSPLYHLNRQTCLCDRL